MGRKNVEVVVNEDDVMKDIDFFLKKIKKIVVKYHAVIEALDKIKTSKKKIDEIHNLMDQREQLVEEYLKLRKITKTNIRSLESALSYNKDVELRSLHDEVVELNSEYDRIRSNAKHQALMEGAPSAKEQPSQKKIADESNDDLLNKAAKIEDNTLANLKSGLRTVEATKELASASAAQLEENRQKLQKVDEGLDEVQSELQISQVIITRIVKRIATDKIIIAFATLLILGIVGIIVYVSIEPDQEIFDVPDIVKPPVQDVTDGVTDLVNNVMSPSPQPLILRRLR